MDYSHHAARVITREIDVILQHVRTERELPASLSIVKFHFIKLPIKSAI